MTKIRLTNRMEYRDRPTETVYVGPGTFDVSDKVVDRFLNHVHWERFDGFDAADWLDVPAAVAEKRILAGSHDDRLQALLDAESDGEQRASVMSAIQDRLTQRGDEVGVKRDMDWKKNSFTDYGVGD